MPRPTDAAFVSHWTSITGALAGVLRAFGGRLSAAEVNARSGHAFRFALVPSAIDAGALGSDGPNCFATVPALRLYAALGARFSAIEAMPGESGYDRARSAAVQAMRDATARGRPTIAYGLHLPEFGIVRAVQGDALLASTAVSAQFGERMPLAQWPAPVRPLPVRVFVAEERTRPSPALEPLLRFVVAYARAGEPAGAVGAGGALSGLAAFERWIDVLESDAPISPSGQAFCLQALQQGRREAAAFLRGADGGIAAPLQAAATAYDAGALTLSQLATLFPYPNGGDVVSSGNRRVGALYVRRVLTVEREAVGHLAAALGR